LRVIAGCQNAGMVPEEVSIASMLTLDAPATSVLFERGHLSRVYGLGLADGRQVVAKVRPHALRHPAVLAVQQYLATAGFPCPAPLGETTGPDHQTVTFEELVEHDPTAGLPARGQCWATWTGRLRTWPGPTAGR
jgi:hypothetical protein